MLKTTDNTIKNRKSALRFKTGKDDVKETYVQMIKVELGGSLQAECNKSTLLHVLFQCGFHIKDKKEAVNQSKDRQEIEKLSGPDCKAIDKRNWFRMGDALTQLCDRQAFQYFIIQKFCLSAMLWNLSHTYFKYLR